MGYNRGHWLIIGFTCGYIEKIRNRMRCIIQASHVNEKRKKQLRGNPHNKSLQACLPVQDYKHALQAY